MISRRMIAGCRRTVFSGLAFSALVASHGFADATVRPHDEERARLAVALEKHVDALERRLVATEPMTRWDAARQRAHLRAVAALMAEAGEAVSATTRARYEGVVGRSAAGANRLPEGDGFRVAGTVRHEATGAPLADVEVELIQDGTGLIWSDLTRADGSYEAFPSAGTYRAIASDLDGYLSEVYEGLDCVADCDPASGDAIVVGAGNEPTNIDFSLQQYGAVSGTVRHAVTGQGIPLVDVVVVDETGFPRGMATSGADGSYTIAGLAPRTYYAAVDTYDEWVGQAYDGVLCVDTLAGPCDPRIGTPIEIVGDAAFDRIDFSLRRGGRIEGRVAAMDTGAGLVGLRVELWRDGELYRIAPTLEDGAYLAGGLPDGTYYLATDQFLNGPYVDLLYPDLLCPGGVDFGGCEPTDGMAFVVQGDPTFTDIDFALPRGGRISGTVTDAATGQGISGLTVSIRIVGSAGPGRPTTTGPDGGYVFDDVLPFEYRVFTGGGHLGFLDEVYDDVRCNFQCDLAAATPVTPPVGGEVSGIDFDLERGARVSGRAIAADTGQTLDFVRLFLVDEAGELAAATSADFFTGDYTLPTVPAGRYFAIAEGPSAYQNEVWDGIQCDGLLAGCEGFGTPIDVMADDVRTGIDFALERLECMPDAQTLCLNQGRFRVRAEWQTTSDTGVAEVVPLTTDAGYLWFFRPDNVEAVVKILDNCNGPTNRFWVFAAGLTNQAVRMTVTDVSTGVEQVYENPLGAAFEPVLDTDAFATCDVRGPYETASIPAAAVAVTGGAMGRDHLCDASDGLGLCLNDGRFRVEAMWRTPQGSSGQAGAVSLTPDTGYFWFFRPENVEVLVKVLDNCNGPTNRFWVFSGGLSNLEIDLTVTDTHTDEVVTYRNPPSTPFAPIQDTGAFATCP